MAGSYTHQRALWSLYNSLAGYKFIRIFKNKYFFKSFMNTRTGAQNITRTRTTEHAINIMIPNTNTHAHTHTFM